MMERMPMIITANISI